MNLKNLIIKCALDIIKDSNYRHQITMSLVGPENVGKTSIINVLLGNEFIESIIPTIRLSKSCTYINLKTSTLKIFYYDIPEQKQLMKNNLSILKNSDIIIFVNDNKNLKIEYNEIRQKTDISSKALIFCINKLDLFKKDKSSIINKYKKNNKNILTNREIRLISALAGDGINDFKKYLQNSKFII